MVFLYTQMFIESFSQVCKRHRELGVWLVHRVLNYMWNRPSQTIDNDKWTSYSKYTKMEIFDPPNRPVSHPVSRPVSRLGR